MKEVLIPVGREAIKSFTSMFIWFKNIYIYPGSYLYIFGAKHKPYKNRQLDQNISLISDLIDGLGLFPAAVEQSESSITHLDLPLM